MGGRETTEITIEVDQVLILRRRCEVRSWCEECGREVEMVAINEAQALTNLTKQMSDGGPLAGWHVSEDGEQRPLVCLESLRKTLYPKSSQQAINDDFHRSNS